MTETWPDYLRRITGNATQAQIAERIGIGRLSVCNWLHGKTRPKAETVITVARVYGRPPVEALLAAQYLEPTEVQQPIDGLSSMEILTTIDEVVRVEEHLSPNEPSRREFLVVHGHKSALTHRRQRLQGGHIARATIKPDSSDS